MKISQNTSSFMPPPSYGKLDTKKQGPLARLTQVVAQKAIQSANEKQMTKQEKPYRRSVSILLLPCLATLGIYILIKKKQSDPGGPSADKNGVCPYVKTDLNLEVVEKLIEAQRIAEEKLIAEDNVTKQEDPPSMEEEDIIDFDLIPNEEEL